MRLRRLVRTRAYAPVKALTARTEIARYLREVDEPKVNLGCGSNLLPGWLNTDLFPIPGAVRLDACAPWPLPSNTFVAVLSEHMIEHIPKEAARKLLKEAFRILRPGGWARVVTPDLSAFARMVLDPSSSEALEYVEGLARFTKRSKVAVVDAVNEIFYCHGHRRIYTAEVLRAWMREIGFDEVIETRGGRYVAPIFEGVDGHPNVIDQRMNEIEAFALEGRKPCVT